MSKPPDVGGSTFSHHVEVAKLKPQEQERWLQVAIDEKLSVVRLRRKIFRAKPSVELTEDELEQRTLNYFYLLENAAQIPAYIVPPWEDSEFLTLPRAQSEPTHTTFRRQEVRGSLYLLEQLRAVRAPD